MPGKKFTSKAKESLPQLQIGIRETSNIRMKKMARPLCPVVDDPNSPYYTGEPNCQRMHNNYPGWWDYCADQGHDPYYRITKRITKEPVVGDDGIITGYREKQLINKKLNLVQVAIGTRFHSGRGETISKGLKGRKDLTEFGLKEKCEYRNCEIDAALQTKYGLFCNERHARLVGADVEGMMLSAKKGEKNKQLKELDLEYEGTYNIQLPPDLDEPSF